MTKIPVANPEIGEEELNYIVQAVKSGWISSKGYFIDEFEKVFAEWMNTKYAITVSNGTVAIHLALLSLGIGPSDSVIVPDLTFASPANMVIEVGAKPIFVDVDPSYWCLDPKEVEKNITPNIKAIIVVHLYGHPAKMDEILEIAEKYNLYVIEDCAEAHGAEFNGKKVGSFGRIATFSFYGNKIITTGEGGMIITNDDELADKIRLYRDHGMKPRYWHTVVGYNYRMTNIQAAIGLAQLKKVEKLIEKKRRIARIYSEELSNISGLRLHPEMEWAKCVYWLYSILIDKNRLNVSRDEFISKLSKYEIETRAFFYPLHKMPAYRNHTSILNNFSASEYLSESGLNLPSGPKISEEEIVYITDKIKKIIKLR